MLLVACFFLSYSLQLTAYSNVRYRRVSRFARERGVPRAERERESKTSSTSTKQKKTIYVGHTFSERDKRATCYYYLYFLFSEGTSMYFDIFIFFQKISFPPPPPPSPR